MFDENVFLFAHLHPNAGALLQKEILLLPDSLGVVSCTDHDITNASLEDSVPQATGALHEDFACLPRVMDPLVADDQGARPGAACGQSQANQPPGQTAASPAHWGGK